MRACCGLLDKEVKRSQLFYSVIGLGFMFWVVDAACLRFDAWVRRSGLVDRGDADALFRAWILGVLGMVR